MWRVLKQMTESLVEEKPRGREEIDAHESKNENEKYVKTRRGS